MSFESLSAELGPFSARNPSRSKIRLSSGLGYQGLFLVSSSGAGTGRVLLGRKNPPTRLLWETYVTSGRESDVIGSSRKVDEERVVEGGGVVEEVKVAGVEEEGRRKSMSMGERSWSLVFTATARSSCEPERAPARSWGTAASLHESKK